MPTLSASDYTNFIKLQAAAQSYRNGAIPKKIQTSDQVVPLQSMLNAQLLASQASYVAASPGTVLTALPSITAASSRIVTGASASGGTVTYTTSVAHGLSVGDVITISGFIAAGEIWANLATQTVIATGLTATQFAVTNAVTPGATNPITGSTVGRINGRVYYTTTSAHGITTGLANTTYSITGLTTTTDFNLTGFTILAVPTTTLFIVSNSADGASITGQTGTLIQTTISVPRTIISGNARVRPYNGVGNVNNPKNLSTVAQSGTLSSGKTQQVGGLPLIAALGSGVYSPTPQLARVNIRATGAYRSVRQPV
jgi:hypothetical protein